MSECKCGSYVINDDSNQKLCDKCWKDAKAKIDKLVAACEHIRALMACGYTPGEPSEDMLREAIAFAKEGN